MSSVYIHIPFCKQKCSYCNFHFSTQTKERGEFLKALEKEIFLRRNEIQTPLETLYFGGGTPSILNPEEWQKIFKALKKNFQISENAEITIEANPDDVSVEFLQGLENTPVNRFSLGVQSFFEEDLKLMNRAHSAQQAQEAIRLIQDFGYQNMTIDLIYGSPTTTNEIWRKNIEIFLTLNIPHLSAYALTVEPRTALAHKIKTGKWSKVDENQQKSQFDFLVKILLENNYTHYEISNFGLAGFESRHNSNYWKSRKYLGLGPSAHSFNGKQRAWNVANNQKYIRALQENTLPLEIEELTEENRINELTMIGLRTSYGVDLDEVNSQFSSSVLAEWHENLERLIQKNYIEQKGNRIFLNPEFRFFADGIAAEMFIV